MIPKEVQCSICHVCSQFYTVCPKVKHNRRSATKPVLSIGREYLACFPTQLCNFSNTDNTDIMIQTN